ncbi:MAG: 50S ribosomal protein L6 [Deltaproteobacteria bacterium]|jgi:large subunit ribosomal protein L6|nr:50S ribosomal protein L6 [Deltaproteobacteria bacterium]
MSRIGKRPVVLEKGVTVKIENGVVQVKGPKGELSLNADARRFQAIDICASNENVEVKRKSDTRQGRTEQGLVRALVQNMVTGVFEGFSKELDIIGVGYRADVKGKVLNLNVGYSNPVEFSIPEGIQIDVDKQNRIKIAGIDKQQVGEVAASIRRVRPPEPYKGKGIRYVDEYVRRKVGKAAAGAAGG